MNYDVIQAKYVGEYRLKLLFSDGASGEVDFLPFIEKGGVFAGLKDLGQFKQFSIDPDWNTVTWKDGDLDIAPETLYFKATGSYPRREEVLKVAEPAPEYGSPSPSQ